LWAVRRAAEAVHGYDIAGTLVCFPDSGLSIALAIFDVPARSAEVSVCVSTGSFDSSVESPSMSVRRGTIMVVDVDVGLKMQIESLVRAISPTDALGRAHRDMVLGWLDCTDDIFRRSKPRTAEWGNAWCPTMASSVAFNGGRCPTLKTPIPLDSIHTCRGPSPRSNGHARDVDSPDEEIPTTDEGSDSVSGVKKPAQVDLEG